MYVISNYSSNSLKIITRITTFIFYYLSKLYNYRLYSYILFQRILIAIYELFQIMKVIQENNKNDNIQRNEHIYNKNDNIHN